MSFCFSLNLCLRGRSFSCGLAAILAICTAAIAFGQQAPVPATLPNERDLMFDELHRDVAAMERELSIYKRVVRLVAPSVVHVQAKPHADFRFRREVEEAGSGVLVSVGGKNYVLTNRHVVKNSDPEHIRLELNDGREISPTEIFADPETDVAVLPVDAPDLIPARVGDSDQCEIGDVVMAFGNPFNLRQSVTRGIISGMGRSNLDLGDGGVDYQNFMQTDAAINPGNSGGPLINLRGEVVGLNTAIASNSGGNDGIGFSIPINIAMSVTRQLVSHGRVDRGFLGVMLDGNFNLEAARSAGLPRLMGALVKQVTERSPAALAGVRTNDVILRYNNAAIENDQHLINLVKLSDVGRPVDMVVLRSGEMVNIQAQIGRLDDFLAETEAALKAAPAK
ncbi:MAG: trypsin-like peptidase domain-containing protein [Planctomycetaceae bacterium]|uniref:Putative periplasmic serine endoprotease DegP-like n=1 Tax=Lacipirellula limnantheis TaxID=2528024 RepID=A0A517U339_9BACT|nr:trypsin-like peptidase domain-containing protein [Lacipirellula limnantheis]MBL9161359.1 trypsin-like peptidase domain-containing protein [Planctomycetaceae bacterium]QDT75042.1 putative periplasmic serine endoprotease DegP-like precursor [Lacipirellula limnantheis]